MSSPRRNCSNRPGWNGEATAISSHSSARGPQSKLVQGLGLPYRARVCNRMPRNLTDSRTRLVTGSMKRAVGESQSSLTKT
jgi:hypothetical protein